MDNSKNKWPIVGNKHTSEYLRRCLNNNKIEQTYILEGPKDLGKNTVLKYFVQCLSCQDNEANRSTPCGQCTSCKSYLSRHPDRETCENDSIVSSDLYTLKKQSDKKNLTVEQVRDFIKKLGLSSFAGKYKIGIIKDAECLSREAANSLLKTLEEPKKNVIIFLIVADRNFLPKTIVSRSQLLKFRAVETGLIYDYLHKIHGAKRSQAKYLSHLADGRPALALKFYKDRDFLVEYEANSEKVFDFFKSKMNDRIMGASQFLDAKIRGQEAVRAVSAVLDIYEGVNRDLNLAHNGIWNRLKYIEKQEEIESILQNLGREKIMNFTFFLNKARMYLRSNLKPQTVLEYLAISL